MSTKNPTSWARLPDSLEATNRKRPSPNHQLPRNLLKRKRVDGLGRKKDPSFDNSPMINTFHELYIHNSQTTVNNATIVQLSSSHCPALKTTETNRQTSYSVRYSYVYHRLVFFGKVVAFVLVDRLVLTFEACFQFGGRLKTSVASLDWSD